MALEDILSLVPIDDIAEKFGVSADVAKKAVAEGGEALLTGLAKNAATDEGSTAIQNALKKHEGGAVVSKVDEVDQEDGGKILKHVFGDKQEEITSKLTESKETAGIDFGKLLPMLAPIVMGLIANNSKKKADAGEGGGIGDLLGGLLGGGSGGGIGDLLGGVLGGGEKSGGLGGLLGGLFGGKK